MNSASTREHAIRILNAGIQAVQPQHLIPRYISREQDRVFVCGERTEGNIYVIGAGKAGAAMAQATEQVIGDHIKAGLVVTKYGHALPSRFIRIEEAAHPVPDIKSVAAVQETLQLLAGVTAQDTVICLLSGGASALWCDVPPGVSLREVQTAFDQLIRSGASIAAINTVRKHLSAIKGGQLIRHCNGARVHTLIISDVPGDDLSVIASGPTVADASTFADACDILMQYNVWSQLPERIRQHIEQGIAGRLPDTPKPGDPSLVNTRNHIVASNSMAVAAAATAAEALGYHTHIAPFETGDAQQAAGKLVELGAHYQGPLPACMIQGGETTVKVTGQGLGGRNQHFALCALKKLEEDPLLPHRLTVVSGGTDGTDGPTDATGAVADALTLDRARQARLDMITYLKTYDAYHFFQQTDSLIITGPTQTNVMDLMILLVH